MRLQFYSQKYGGWYRVVTNVEAIFLHKVFLNSLIWCQEIKRNPQIPEGWRGESQRCECTEGSFGPQALANPWWPRKIFTDRKLRYWPGPIHGRRSDQKLKNKAKASKKIATEDKPKTHTWHACTSWGWFQIFILTPGKMDNNIVSPLIS